MKSWSFLFTSSLGIGALLMLGFSQPLFAGPPTARQLPSLMPTAEFVIQHAAEIGLSPAQNSQLESALAELQPASEQSAAQVRQESNVLAQLLGGDHLDEAKVTAQFEKVLVAENEAKRVRLKLSLRTRAVLTPEQQGKLDMLQHSATPRRAASPEQQELAVKMAKVKELIERAKDEGRDLGNVREMWKRVYQATEKRNITEASRILDEAEASLSTMLAAPTKK